ncbi:Na+ antiporter NhaC [Methanococcus vannielii SB]|uniref:Na+ antiporter NhaC n=1 Tax=Methanococcus vannielii (strain ATCC 35089 / DSM 1224 / JCM 13029 / OCM 148 / SB) TaxID=406327 RepID=A6USD5_METVS|nr:Na+/H+ antiporter NhaC family protein [Methanococcus vannielii]ABR55407.1 Na+ antiporter NhaC [Methanococcus vannielii SB]
MDFGALSLLPPIVAIGLALLTKRVYTSLFLGILTGSLIYNNGSIVSTVFHIINTVLDSIELTAITGISSFTEAGNLWNLLILLFLVILGILIAMITRAGGALAYGNLATNKIKSKEGACLSTSLLGLLLFVDDYFNCLTVGTVMRPITDKFKVSRAKLAYIIDSTAAPVCILMPVSSWFAAVVGNLSESGIGSDSLSSMSPSDVFISSILYNSYALIALFMVLVIISFKKWDFGPMKVHEKVAEETGDLFNGNMGSSSLESEIKPLNTGKISYLVLPLVLLITAIISAFLISGGLLGGVGIIEAFQAMDASWGLFWGGLITLVITTLYFIISKAILVSDIPKMITKGTKLMIPAISILILAWSLGSIIKGDLGTGSYLAGLIQNNLPVQLLPAILFALSGFMAFATGTSWGTFGIMLPIAIPLAVALGMPEFVVPFVAAVLGGAIYGDHSSPISDTTIMSSTGAGVKHIDHVQTQLPYTTLIGVMAFIGYILVGYTINFGYWVSGILNLLFVGLSVFFISSFISKKMCLKCASN